LPITFFINLGAACLGKHNIFLEIKLRGIFGGFIVFEGHSVDKEA